MRITIRLPDDMGEEVKRRTDNVSAYVQAAIAEKLRRAERDAARQQLLRYAGTGIDSTIDAENQRERREGDRDRSNG